MREVMAAEELVKLAGQAGFVVQVGPPPGKGRTGKLYLYKIIYARGGETALVNNEALTAVGQQRRSEAEGVGFGLLYQVPLSGAVIEDTYHTSFDIGQRSDGDIVRVGVSIMGVDGKYLEEVHKLASVENVKVDRRLEVERNFQHKVEEELGEDLEVVAIEAEIEAATRLIKELEEARLVRKAKVRLEREELMGSFDYVTDEREL
jgi:hypothetical protein